MICLSTLFLQRRGSGFNYSLWAG